MKNYILCLLCGLVVTTSSCADWLDVRPKSEIKADNLFESRQGFLSALSGIYSNMRKIEMYGGNAGLSAVDVMAQYYDMGAIDLEFYNLAQFDFEHEKNKSLTQNLWSNYYTQIANCNYILQYVDERKTILGSGYYEILKAEVLALRAYLHFDILRLFGPQPAEGNDKPAIPYYPYVSAAPSRQCTFGEVCGWIVEDLLTARNLLKVDPILAANYEEKSKYTTEEYIEDDGFMLYRKDRMNYYAVTALLARVELYRGNRNPASEYAREIIDSGKFPMIVSTDEQVTNAASSLVIASAKKEYIFALYHNKLNTITSKFFEQLSGQVNKSLLDISHTYRQELFTCNGVYNSNVDFRERMFYEKDGNVFVGKYASSTSMPNTRIPMIKISEMYLIAAECANSVNYLDTLRVHRGIGVQPVADLQDEIRREYLKEFIAEGQYFYYCKRNNLARIRSVAMDSKKYRLPFPENELDYGAIYDRN